MSGLSESMERMMQSAILERFAGEVWASASPEARREFADEVVKRAKETLFMRSDEITRTVMDSYLASDEGKRWREAALAELAKRASANMGAIVEGAVSGLSFVLRKGVEDAMRSVTEDIKREIEKRISAAIGGVR